MEEWRKVNGYEGLYEISSLGRLRRCARTQTTKAGWTRDVQEIILKPFIAADGKQFIDLTKEGECTRFPVHHLVLRAFIGERPEGFVGCHNNGNGLDNRADNLRWDTQKGNLADTIIHGTRIQGSKHAASKLHESDIPLIRSRSANGESQQKIADSYNVCRELIGQILRGQKWKHV